MLSSLGEPVFNIQYFHPRFQRRIELPTTESIAAIVLEEGELGSGGNVDIPMSCSGYDPTVAEDTVEFDIAETDGNDPHTTSNFTLRGRRTRLEENFQKFMSVARPLAEFVQTSSEMTDIACNMISNLHTELRHGNVPSTVAVPVPAMFEPVEAPNVDNAIADTNINQARSFRRLPGPQKRTRIVGQYERARVAKQKKVATNKQHGCKICLGNNCNTCFCRTLANFGQIVKPDQDHHYDQVLAMEIPLVSSIQEFDFTADPFESSWEFVLLKEIFKDEKGFKYLSLEALNKNLQLLTPSHLYTFTALKQWLATKTHKKKLMLKSGVTWSSLAAARFLRPKIMLQDTCYTFQINSQNVPATNVKSIAHSK